MPKIEHTTYASNPGAFKVNYFKLMRYNFKSYTSYFLVAIFFCIGAIIRSEPLLCIIPLLISIIFFRNLRSEKYHFVKGDINISKIISLNPPIFVVSTNMQKSLNGKIYPALKVVKDKIPRAPGFDMKEGTYFPSACLYQDSGSGDHWVDFNPKPISQATNDERIIKRHMKGLEYLIDDFEKRLEQMTYLKKEGIYFLDAAKLYPDGSPERKETTLNWNT